MGDNTIPLLEYIIHQRCIRGNATNVDTGLQAALDFLRAMEKIETMTGHTQEEMDTLKGGILRMAEEQE